MSETLILPEVDLSNIPKVTPRRILQLVLKTWPFIRPLVKHLLILLALGGISALMLAGPGLIGADLFTNKILVGDKLQPIQAAVLFLDESYETSDITDNVNLKESLPTPSSFIP